MERTFVAIVGNQLGGDDRLLRAAGRLGGRALFPFQEEVLASSGILDGESLCCIAPTGAGKSLIGEGALLRALARGRMAVWLAPTRALARERAESLGAALGPESFRVVASTRDDREADEEILAGRVDVVVAVYEKARTLFLRGAGFRRSVGLLVVDECHLLEDPDRGVGARVLVEAWRREVSDFQIVALTSQDRIAGRALFPGSLPVHRSEARPVALWRGEIDLQNGEARWREGDPPAERRLAFHSDAAGDLCQSLAELVPSLEKPVLFFASTRRDAARLAGALARRSSDPKIEDLEDEEDGVTAFLRLLIGRRVGLHTAELTRRQRLHIERLLRDGGLDVCVATTTLAEGLNTGVRTVVVLPGVGRLAPGGVENLLGRAGRPGAGPGIGFVIRGAGDSLENSRDPAKPRTTHQNVLESASFHLALEGPLHLDDLRGRLRAVGLDEGTVEGGLAQGVRQGFWAEANGVAAIQPPGQVLAAGGVDAEAVAGWRTILRRFPEGAGAAAMVFLALGGTACSRSLPLAPDERTSGRWAAALAEELSAEYAGLARYFLRFLEPVESLPRSTHQAAKGTLLYLQALRGASIERLSTAFRMAPGLIEEFLHTAAYLVHSVGEFCRQAGHGGVVLPDPAPVREGASLSAVAPPSAPPAGPRLVILRGSTGLVRIDGKELCLTRLQFRLLELLARNAGKGVCYERIERAVWPDARVERQQVAFHRRNLDLRLTEVIGTTESLVETVATWGLRLRLPREEVLLEGSEAEPATLLERPARVIPINSVAGEVCV